MPRFGLFVMAALAAGLLFRGAAAQASVSIEYPEFEERFSSYRACVAALEKAWSTDKARITDLSTLADGTRRQVSLDTKGVEKLGRRLAKYEATWWQATGRYRSDLRAWETSHYFSEQSSTCRNGTMRTKSRNGNTLSSFEPAESPDQQ